MRGSTPSVWLLGAVALWLVACDKPCLSKLGVESKPAGARIFLRGDHDVTFSPVFGMAGTKQDKTAATPDNVAFRWSDEGWQKIWIKVIWEDETESEPIQVSRCENARLVFPRTGRPEKHRVIIKSDDDASLDRRPNVSMVFTNEACSG